MKKKVAGTIVCVLVLMAGVGMYITFIDKRNVPQANKEADREIKISEQMVQKEGRQEGDAAPELRYKVKDACNILDEKNVKSVLGESTVKKGLHVTFEGRVQVTQCSYESDAYKVALTLRRHATSDDAKQQLGAIKTKTPQTLMKGEYILSAAATNNAGTTTNTVKAQAILDNAVKGL